MKEKNEMPRGWVIADLQDAVDVLDNLRKPINSDERETRIAGKKESKLYPYYGATGQVGWIDDFITDGEYVLVGEDGAPFLDFYKPKAYIIKGKTWVNNHAHILRFKEDFTTNAFILHFLNHFNYNGYVNGTTRLKLTKSRLAEIPFPLPPLPEQQRIVAKIEELFSSLDKGIESLNTAQQQLKFYRQAVLKWAFEGKLTNINVNDGELPKGWKWVNLNELCEVKDGTHDTPKYIEKGIPFVTQKNIKESGLTFDNVQYITESDHEKFFKRSNVTYGDILISMIGANRGMCCIVNDKRIFSIKNVGLVKGNNKNIFTSYLLYYLKSVNAKNYVKSLSKGGAQEFVGLTELRRFPIMFAPLDEQHTLVAEIESRLSVCDKIEESIEQSLMQSESLRQSILKKAFEGKLVPQDPNDEPASKLLERIKAEKEKNKKVKN